MDLLQIREIRRIRNMNDVMKKILFICYLDDIYNSITEIIPVIPLLNRQNAEINEEKCTNCNIHCIFDDNLCCECIIKSNNRTLIYKYCNNDDFKEFYSIFVNNIKDNYDNFFEQYPPDITLDNNIPYYHFLLLFFGIFKSDYDSYVDIFNNYDINNFIYQ